MGFAYAAWGCCGLVVSSYNELRVFRVHSHLLSLRYVIPGASGQPVFSPDGAYFVTNYRVDFLNSAGASVVRVVRTEDGAIQAWDDIPYAWSWPSAAVIVCCAVSDNRLVPYPLQDQQLLCFGYGA